MVIPTQQQAYSQAQGTTTIPAFVFSNVDPGPYNSGYPLYQGWVNTVTKAIWYLEALVPANGSVTAQWRAVGPIVKSITDPLSSDYQYPIGQTWVNTASSTYWGLVNITGTTATWVSLGGGSSSGIVSVEVDADTPLAQILCFRMVVVRSSSLVVRLQQEQMRMLFKQIP